MNVGEFEKKSHMPMLAYGTWKIDNGTPTTEAVLTAVENGYRHIDTAAGYGNDFAVGKAVKKCSVPREELFITNKLWNSYRGCENAIQACKRTLKLMKLEYLDAYLIHWPASSAQFDNWEELNLETWRGMEELQKEGLVRYIGVSNFQPHHLKKILEEGKVRPFVNQFEMHPGKNQKELLDFCMKEQILPMAWSPLGHGKVLEHPVLVSIAKRHDRTPAQICLRYCLQKGMAVVTRSVHSDRMKDNRQVFDFSLDMDEMKRIDEMESLGDTGLNPDDSALEEKLAAL